MSAGTDRAEVVVIGAGPTGITAATLLADRGVHCLVLERFADVYPRPRAVAMDDEVRRILGRMGLEDDVAGITRPVRGMRVVDDVDRAVLAEVGRSVGPGRHGLPESSLFDQPELETILRAGLTRRRTARLHAGVEVTGVVPHELGDGGVTVTFTDAVSGRRGSVAADYVLGCDGANSLVRDVVGARMEDLGFTQRWLVVDVATGADLGQWDGIHQVCSTRRAATFIRIGPERYRWEFQLHDGESASDLGTIDALRPLLRPWLRGVPDDELRVQRVTDYTFHAQVADRWRAGRVLLLGDAAHLTPPFIGQGMGAGIRDADNLAWKLADVLRGRRPESDLDTYETERRPHASAMIRGAVALGRVMTAGGRLGGVLRRTLLPRLSSLPAVAARLDGVTPSLHRSALVRASRPSHGLAGTLCPNAPVRPDGRVDDRTRGRFALVTDLPVDASSGRSADRADVAVLAVAPSHSLGRWLAAGHARAALVRPDGTVMAAGSTVDRVLAVLGRG